LHNDPIPATPIIAPAPCSAQGGAAHLRQVAYLLCEIASAAAVLADHVQSEISVLPKRHILDETLATIRWSSSLKSGRLRRVAGLFSEACRHAQRSHAALGHITLQHAELPHDQ
jgi:hypothetical protein